MLTARKNNYQKLEIELMQPAVAFDMPPEPTSPTSPSIPFTEPVIQPPSSVPPAPATPTPPPISTASVPPVTMVTEPVDQTFTTPPPERKFHHKTLLLVLVTIFIAVTIPLVVFVAQQRQDIRQRASVAEPCYVCNTIRRVCEDTGLRPPAECTSSLNECGTPGTSCGEALCNAGQQRSMSCTTGENCPGNRIQICNSSGVWVDGPCDDIAGDNCPAPPQSTDPCKECFGNSCRNTNILNCNSSYNECNSNGDCRVPDSTPSPSPIANFGWNGSCFTSVPLGNGCFAVRYICRNRDASGQCNDTNDPQYKEYHNPGDGNPCFANNICGTQQIDIDPSCAFNPNVCPIEHATICDFHSTNNYPACLTALPSPSASPGLGDCGSSCDNNNQCSGLDCTCNQTGCGGVCWGNRCNSTTPSPTPPAVAAQCDAVKLYSVTSDINLAGNWHLFTTTELTQRKPGDILYVTTLGSGINSGVINRARIRVATGTTQPTQFTTTNETTIKKPKILPADPDEYYIQYTIPATLPTPPTFTFDAEVCVLNAGNQCAWW